MNSPDIFRSFNALHETVGGAYYLLNTGKFTRNCSEFRDAFRLRYGKFNIAYPYKANYLPPICRAANDFGAFAEVSSGAEYAIATCCKVKADKIIINGPYHTEQEVNLYLESGSLFILDNIHQLQLVINYCQRNPAIMVNIGLRVNFELYDTPRSRFGIPEEDIPDLLLNIAKAGNVRIQMLHCHFSFKDRSIKSFQARASKLISIYKKYFPEVEYLNIGGGFFGKMPEILKNQFSAEVPDFAQYAEGITDVFKSHIGSDGPVLLAEPGSALVADTMDLVCRVVEIKSIGSKKIIITDASRQNLHPGYREINLPVNVLAGKPGKAGEYDITGYTCMENDVLYKSFIGQVAVGDLLVFSNCGAYSFVNKPPFIRPQLPVFEQRNGDMILSVQAETSQDWMKRLI